MSRRLRTQLPRFAFVAAATLALTTLLPVASYADSASGCDFEPNGTTESCSAPLAGSTFEGGDGNLVPNAVGRTDWSTVSGLSKGIDAPSGGSDNSFGQGTKEDDADVNVVTGSIPPNKSDLTRFYATSEFASNSNFLYLAWERTNVLGSANMDFEINQRTTPGLGAEGPHTIIRTAGDLLVTFDFTNGGGTPTLGLLKWVTAGATSQCFASNNLPCWGNRVLLNGSDSIGAVNNAGSVTDPIAPDAPRSLPSLTFGETSINLTAAGVFPSGSCLAFGSAFLKSRASASFPAEVKDFVGPVPVNISNCGAIKIIKNTEPRGLNQSFSYTSTIPNPVGTSTSPSCASDTTPSSFTLNDQGNTSSNSAGNTESCTNVLAGSYTVTEGTPPAGFTLKSLTCVATGTGSSGSKDATNAAKANIVVAPNGLVTCTYINKGSGAILVTKTAKNHSRGPGDHPLAGATFTVNGVSKTTGADGKACFSGLTIGSTYPVAETSAPAGYERDSASKNVAVASLGTCTTGTQAGVSFTNTPLADLTVKVVSEAAGVTNSSISCVVQGSATNVGDSPQGPSDPVEVTADGLKPGTYTCTVVVDP